MPMKKKQTTQLRYWLASTRRTFLSASFNLCASICLTLVCVLGTPAYADTITVTNTNDSGPGSLRQALADANDGDTINFDPSLNGQAIGITSAELVIDKSIAISGPGPDLLAVRVPVTGPFIRIFHVMSSHIVTIDGLTIGPNWYCDSGCGIFNDQATVTVSNCAVHGNTARDGGAGISYAGPTTIINSSVTDNVVLYSGSGAGIYGGGSLTITNSRISSNVAGKQIFYGGGIAAAGTVTITSSTISGNSVSTGGGGIYASGTLTIIDSTISGNSAGGNDFYPQSGAGGGIAAPVVGTTVIVSNSTISDNIATGSNYGPSIGGAISGGLLSITNSTLSGNSADQGGGIWNGGTLDIGNTILNAGSTGENIFNNGGTITSHGYNLSSDNGGGYLNGPGDQINTDPVLGPLQDNGGPTLTHALLPGSPAIDTGDPNFTPPPYYDQRGPGFDRVVNGRIDVGSFEVQPGKPTPTPTPSATPTATPTATVRPTPTPRPRATPRTRPTPPPRP
jgi:predicted outer membrane repeat protein